MGNRADLKLETASDRNLVERLALKFLRSRARRREPHVHRWSRPELSEIRRTEYWTIAVAALSGAVSGGILGGVEIWLHWGMVEEAGASDWRQQLPYWSVFLGLTVLVSGTEILFLYWFVLRMVARISSIAGLRLSNRGMERVIAIGLARSALDLPNPRTPICGIDPFARVSRWRLLAYSILYRIKIGVSSFVLRVVLRRVLARAALRFFIPLIGIPLFAVWNALIIWWLLRQVRIRAAGPVAVRELAEGISAERSNLDERSRRLVLQTVGESILRSRDAHPNFVLLLHRLLQDLEISPDPIAVDWDSSRASLKNASRKTQDVVLTTLSAAVILARRPRSAQRELLEEVHTTCGRSFQAEALLDLYREFVRGQGLSEKHLQATGSESATSS